MNKKPNGDKYITKVLAENAQDENRLLKIISDKSRGPVEQLLKTETWHGVFVCVFVFVCRLTQ